MRTRRGGVLEFESFCIREYERVFRAVRLFGGDPELAEDVTQEAFTRAFVRWRRLQQQTWAGGWVMRTALNLCRAALKKRTRDFPAVTDAPSPGSSERIDIVRALRRLPPRQREIAVLYYWGDLSTGAIAEVTGISEGTVRAHLAHARDALRVRLEVAGA